METTINPEVTRGFVVGMIDGPNELILSFGQRGADMPDTLTASDVFPIGSVSKVISAAVCAELDASGQLPLSTKMSKILPADPGNLQSELTIRELLGHQSGLPRDPLIGDNLSNPLRTYAKYSREDLLNGFHDYAGPRRMLYSNYGYAILGIALSERMGAEYPEVLHDVIIEKCLMPGTTTDPTQITVTGYDLDGQKTDSVEYRYFAPSGGINSTCQDLLAFLKYCLKDAHESLWENMGQGMNKYLDIGLGWHIVAHRKSTIYMHTGRSLGHSAFIGVNRATRTGVVVLSNSAMGTDDLGMEILRMMNDNWKRKT